MCVFYICVISSVPLQQMATRSRRRQHGQRQFMAIVLAWLFLVCDRARGVRGIRDSELKPTEDGVLATPSSPGTCNALSKSTAVPTSGPSKQHDDFHGLSSPQISLNFSSLYMIYIYVYILVRNCYLIFRVLVISPPGKLRFCILSIIELNQQHTRYSCEARNLLNKPAEFANLGGLQQRFDRKEDSS